jgi:hypothetical protein
MILYHTLSRGRFFYNAVVASPELIDELDLSHLEAPEGYVYCLLEILDEQKRMGVASGIATGQLQYMFCSAGLLLLLACWAK